jgi:hypothetical protein
MLGRAGKNDLTPAAARSLEDVDMHLHARQGHGEFLGKVGDLRVRTSKPLRNAASRGIRQRGDRGIEVGL